MLRLATAYRLDARERDGLLGIEGNSDDVASSADDAYREHVDGQLVHKLRVPAKPRSTHLRPRSPHTRVVNFGH